MASPPVATICVTVPDPVRRPLARYGLGEAAARLGIRLRLVEGEPQDGQIVYGPVPDNWRGATLAYDPRCYDATVRFAALGRPPRWAPEGAGLESVDLVGGLARLLTLADEAQVDERARNANGIFRNAALPAARARVEAVPLVEHHVAALGQRLRAIAPGLPPLGRPRWPGGRRLAVLLTHDTDAVALGAPMEIVFNAAKAVVRADRVRARMAWAGLTLKGEDPLFGFGKWAALERAAALRSAFFLFGRGCVRPTLNDCRSSVFGRAVDWDLLRALADDGWEFGLHSPIRAKFELAEFQWGKQAVEQRIGQPVHGLRHHYWSIDWRQPHLTFRKHVSAGFRYDSSMAWRDTAGFRAGTCLPYRPFDPERQRALALYELPTTLMDAHVLADGGDPEAAVRRVLELADAIRRVGGMLVLDWHTEAAAGAFCYRNVPAVLAAVIEALRGDSETWFATPWAAARHWEERCRALDTDA